MNKVKVGMKPQDVVVLLKIITYGNKPWKQIPLAEALKMSQSEISQSLARSRFAGLLDIKGKEVMRNTFMDFLEFGLSVVFPAKPGPVVRGVPTAHSAPPLSSQIITNEVFVWPYSKGYSRGRSIEPLYDTVPQAALGDEELYSLLALCDALRVGKKRENQIALNELRRRIC